MKEADIEREVCKYAESCGFMVRKFTSPGIVGVPDRIFIGFGLVFFIEFKALGGKLSAMQEREMNRIREHGVKCFVVYDVDDGKRIIDGAIRTARMYPGCERCK